MCILCRFGAQFKVPMPDHAARREILKLILNNHEREMPGSVDSQLLTVNVSECKLLAAPDCCLFVAKHKASPVPLALCTVSSAGWSTTALLLSVPVKGEMDSAASRFSDE